jgi:hypothetical protein
LELLWSFNIPRVSDNKLPYDLVRTRDINPLTPLADFDLVKMLGSIDQDRGEPA